MTDRERMDRAKRKAGEALRVEAAAAALSNAKRSKNGATGALLDRMRSLSQRELDDVSLNQTRYVARKKAMDDHTPIETRMPLPEETNTQSEDSYMSHLWHDGSEEFKNSSIKQEYVPRPTISPDYLKPKTTIKKPWWKLG